MTLQEQLLYKGYKKYVSESNRLFKVTDTLFQKRIRGENGTKYFINCWYYPAKTIDSHILPETLQFEADFSWSPEQSAMTATLREKDIDKAEELLEVMWGKMWFGLVDVDDLENF